MVGMGGSTVMRGLSVSVRVGDTVSTTVTVRVWVGAALPELSETS